MKRSWIGLLLLLVLLAVGLLSAWAMEEVHEPVSEHLEEASEAALAGQWGKAAFLVAAAQRNWENWKLLRTALADHGPSEEIEALFAVLEVYGTAREEVAFSALCREMAEKIEAIGEAHGLVPENIL